MQQRQRFGYQQLHTLLRRDGITIKRKKACQLYREADLIARRRKGRNRTFGGPALAPAPPNHRRSLDFVRDQLVSDRRFRALNIVGDETRECAQAVVSTSTLGQRVVRKLTDMIAEPVTPTMIVSANSIELTSNAVLIWAGDAGIECPNVAPVKPT
jgi:putative transposase